MKWGRFGVFLISVVAVLGLAAGTALPLWQNIKLGLDLKGGFDLLYQIEGSKDNPITPQGIQAALQAVQLRVNKVGTTSPIIQLENRNQIRVDLAGTFNQAKAEEIIGQTADLKIYGQAMLIKGQYVPDPSAQPLMTGKDLKSNASASVDQMGQNVVVVNFKDPSKWQAITKAYYKKPIYTFLNGKLLTAATIDGVMSTGSAQISGGSLNTVQACTDLAQALNAGALPYPLHKIGSTQVGPSLGRASLQATMTAGLIAVSLIFAFMIWMYRLAGLIANFALIAYAYVMLLVFTGAGIVLTLPGLAAVVLGIGMAVDANIITYERIKDEIRNGKSLQSSVISGNRRALRTIIDSNTTTFIAASVMFWIGQGDIRGFAIALMLSIIISLLTAVLFSRFLLMQFTKSNAVRKPWWYGIGKGALPQ